MTQSDFATIDPATKSGTTLASDLNSFRDALNSLHGGSSRPTYAQAGMIWRKVVSSTVWDVYLFDGTDDILLGTANPTANTWTPNLGGTALSSLATATVGNGLKIASGALVTKLFPQAQTSGFTISSTHRANALWCTGSFTIALTAAATLGSDFFCYIAAISGDLTIDPAGAETIDGASTLVLRAGETALLICDGAQFRTDRQLFKDIVSLTEVTTADNADYIALWDASIGAIRRQSRANFLTGIGGGSSFTAFTSPGTTSWTKPAGGNIVLAEIWGGGASGGRHGNNSGGGGGGGYAARFLRMSLLLASETVIVGAGGAAITGSNATGNPGGFSSFSTSANLVSAGGGGGGGVKINLDQAAGGGGGGEGGGAGSTGTQSAGGVGGFFDGAAGGGPGAIGADSTAGRGGGGGGGSLLNVGSAGGRSSHGGGGGGGAGSGGANGSGGASVHAGAGGNGSSVSGGTGGSGVAPAGGGGAARGTSGAGGRGELRVWVF